MRVLFVIAQTVALGLFAAPAAARPKLYKVEAAQKLLLSGKVDEALALVDPIIAQALKSDAKEPDAMCPSEATALLQEMLKQETKRDVLITTENDWCKAMLVKGYALNELKRPQEAEAILAALTGHAPNNAQYLVEYAYTARLNGRLEKAMALFKDAEARAAAMTNRDSGAHWQAVALRGQGYIHVEYKRWDDAQQAYQRSLELEPANKLALGELKFIEDTRPR